MKGILFGLAFFALLMSSTTAAAENFDGSEPLLCASVEAIDCVADSQCIRDTPESIGAPQFLRVDFDGKQITGTKRTSSVLHKEESQGQIILQGMELGMGWVFSLNQLTGKFSATLSASDGVFVIFGACTTYHQGKSVIP